LPTWWVLATLRRTSILQTNCFFSCGEILTNKNDWFRRSTWLDDWKYNAGASVSIKTEGDEEEEEEETEEDVDDDDHELAGLRVA
jgi:hypothetical protein